MKRRNLIRNVAAGSLLVAGVGSAGAMTRESDSTMYKVRPDGDTLEVVETLDGGVSIESHCDHDDPSCCVDKCCNCGSGCDVCYCHEYCDGVEEG